MMTLLELGTGCSFIKCCVDTGGSHSNVARLLFVSEFPPSLFIRNNQFAFSFRAGGPFNKWIIKRLICSTTTGVCPPSKMQEDGLWINGGTKELLRHSHQSPLGFKSRLSCG